MKSTFNLFLIFFLFFFACQSSEKKTTETTATSTTTTVANQALAKNTNKIAEEPKQEGSYTMGRRFKLALIQMKKMSYTLKNYKELTPEKNILNGMINLANSSGKYDIPTVDISTVEKVKRGFVKGTIAKSEDTYPRASIESWECKDETAAKAMIKNIDAIKKDHPWDVISKSPITYWQQGKEVIFIVPGGFYMLDDVPKLKTFLVEMM